MSRWECLLEQQHFDLEVHQSKETSHKVVDAAFSQNMGSTSVPVLELWSLLQELQAWMRKQNAGHHRLQVIWGYIPTTLFPQDIKHAAYRVHLDPNNNAAPVNSFFGAVGIVAQPVIA